MENSNLKFSIKKVFCEQLQFPNKSYSLKLLFSFIFTLHIQMSAIYFNWGHIIIHSESESKNLPVDRNPTLKERKKHETMDESTHAY